MAVLLSCRPSMGANFATPPDFFRFPKPCFTRRRPAVLPHADRSPMRRSTAVALLAARCKQDARPPRCARQSDGIMPDVHSVIYGFENLSLTSAYTPKASMGARIDGSRPLPSFVVRRKLEPSGPYYYGVTHAHFVVASGNPFASNSSRCCEQKSTSRPSVWSFVVESESVPKWV
jgi:hypothetical protein